MHRLSSSTGIILALSEFVISDSKAPIPQENQLLDFKESIPESDEREGHSAMCHSSLSELDPGSTKNQNPTSTHLLTLTREILLMLCSVPSNFSYLSPLACLKLGFFNDVDTEFDLKL